MNDGGGVDPTYQHLVTDFIDETLPLAEAAGALVLELERAWSLPDLPVQVVAELRSRVHTVKGNAAMMGLTPLADAAHAIEDLVAVSLELSRPRPRRPVELMLAGTDLLVRMTRTAGDGLDAEAAGAFRRAAMDPLAAPEVRPHLPGRTSSSLASTSTVRVDFNRLDELLAAVGEAAIGHATILRILRTLRPHAGELPGWAELEPAALALARTLRIMRRGLLEVRLVPLSTLLARFPRHVRDLAHERGQPLALAITGAETPIDKGIVDRLGEPLMHLVRNAVAHGIEPAEERRRVGKPVEGQLRIAARLESGHVIIEVGDDGRGLDDAAIRAKARALGLGDGDASFDDARQLIFRSGLSTADGVTQLAGRGVGLDAVAAALRGLGGSIDVDSTPGRGCVFRLSVPVSLLLVRGLLCELGGESLLVPAAAVAEVVALDAATRRALARHQTLTWRGQPLGVLDGGALLGLGRTGGRSVCMVLSAGQRRRGFLVDRVVGHQEVVVQPLASPVGRPRHLAGATILGSGAVALILDAARVVGERACA
jgi:two-component system chemotaxis sensor kinase CheA